MILRLGIDQLLLRRHKGKYVSMPLMQFLRVRDSHANGLGLAGLVDLLHRLPRVDEGPVLDEVKRAVCNEVAP